MKKSDPKLILNLSVENDELEKKVEIAMERYAEKLISKNLDETIEKIVTRRIEEIVTNSSNKYSCSGKINGKTLDDYVREKANVAISSAIDKNIKEILAKKIVDMI